MGAVNLVPSHIVCQGVGNSARNRSGGPYSTHRLQRGKAQSKAAGGKGAFAKEDTFRKKAGDRQKDKN